MFGDDKNPWDLPEDPPPSPQEGIDARQNADYSASIAQWYRQYLGREAQPWEIQSWLQGGTPISQVENGIRNSPEAQQHAAPPQTQAPPPSTPGNSGGGGPAPNVGGLVTPFGGSFTPPASTPYPNAPQFTPPTMGEAANDPGYLFTLNQGKKNLESWLAAHGTFNDSSAAEALQQYGQGAAATQYGTGLEPGVSGLAGPARAVADADGDDAAR
jgi:hypothetical protein